MRPDHDNDESAHYQGEGGAAYFDSQSGGDLRLRGELNARTKFARYVRPEHTVLDFGCGSGTLLACLDCRGKIGVELNPAARAEAARHGIEAHPSVDAVPDAVADVVVSNHALEHVASPLRTLRALAPKLKPGGKLVVVVPVDDWRVQRKVDPHDRNHHLYTWTPLLLGNLLIEAGYAAPNVEVLTHAWFPHWERWIRRLPRPVFDAVCASYARIYKLRQLIAVASPGELRGAAPGP